MGAAAQEKRAARPMLSFFRNFFKSKLGVVFTLGFLVLIGFAFALSDVSNTSMFGGVAGGDRVAVVGDRRIDAADLSTTATSAMEQARQQNPTLSMQSFVAGGGVDDVLEGMISRWAIAEFSEDFGLRAGKRLVDSEIAGIAAFRGASGEFDQNVYRQALAQQGLNEAAVRQDIAQGLLARQLVVAAGFGARPPLSIARRYAQLLGERREGRIGALPAAAYAPAGEPTAAQLQAFYTENRDDYIRPERRVIRFASFGEEAFGDIPAPTQQLIARRYQRDIASYQPKERRGFTQLVVPTQAAAQAVVAEVRGGISLEASAQAKGLATTPIAATDKAAFTTASSAAVAEAAFAAGRGALAAPAQGPLGWYVLRIDSIERDPGRTLDQARADIAAQLTAEMRRTAMNETTARIEQEMAEGRSLAEVAAELGLELASTAPITATGQVYGTNTTAPQALAPIIQVAFEMEEGEPQLAETVPGTSFLIYDVAEITPSAVAPLAEIRADVVLAWRRARGMEGAAAAAARVIERIRGGQTMQAALAAEQKPLPGSEAIGMDRRQLAALGQQGQVPPALMLLFSMAEGTAKALPQDAAATWFVLQLDDIVTPELAEDAPEVADTAAQLGITSGQEYGEQLTRAVEAALDVEVNQPAVDAVIAALTGQAG
jgi:peptidyl-prolyl cis-trans isomerase D